MKPLPTPPLPNAILSLDFDGTMHDPGSSPAVPTGLFACLRRLRDEQHVLWGVNTGRSLDHAMEGFSESAFPFLPDWVVAREREIYQADGTGHWMPHAPWNKRCEKEVQGLFKRVRKLLARIRHEVEEHTGAQWLEMAGEPAGVISRTVEEMEWIVSRIVPLAAEEPHLSWQRNSIYLRFGHRDFHKGSSLGEIARLHRLPAARCFAMGDSHNDMEMLDPAHAGMTACPANSVPEVLAKVRSHGGLVTCGIHGAGVIEALEHFFGASH